MWVVFKAGFAVLLNDPVNIFILLFSYTYVNIIVLLASTALTLPSRDSLLPNHSHPISTLVEIKLVLL